MVEKRCKVCNKLLLRTVEVKINATIEIKCSKCKSVNVFKGDEHQVR